MKTATYSCVCSPINSVGIFRITSYTIIEAIIFSNLSSVAIASASVTFLKVATYCQGPHHYHCTMLHCDGSIPVFGSLFDRYNIVEHEDLAWITSNDPSRMILEAFVYTRLRYHKLAFKKNFAMFDLLGNWKSVCKWNWLMKECYTAHSIACFKGRQQTLFIFAVILQGDDPKTDLMHSQQWLG